MLKRKLEKKKDDFANLTKRFADHEAREKEVESSIEEVETKEEEAEVDKTIQELEVEKDQLEKEKAALEAEISEIEQSISELEAKEPNEPTPANKEDGNERKRGSQMAVRKKFFGLTMEQRDAFLARSEVKEFFQRYREFKNQKRAINGAELNIPEVMLDLLRNNIDRYSKLITKVRLKSVKGKARQNIIGAIPEAIWMEMIDALKELTISFNQIEVDGYKVGGFIAIPNSLMEDSDVNLATETIDSLGQAIGLAVDKAIVYGKGVKMPLGIVTRLAQETKPSNYSSKAPEWKDVHITNLIKFDSSKMQGQDLLSKIIVSSSLAKEDYSDGELIWIMNRETKNLILSKLVTFNAAGTVIASLDNQMPIVGGEIIDLPFIPAGDVVCGFSSLYLLVEREGGSVVPSEHAQFIQDNTVLRGTARYDGCPVFGEGFFAMNLSNVDVTKMIAFAGEETPPAGE